MRKSTKRCTAFLLVLLLIGTLFMPVAGAVPVSSGKNPVIYFEVPESWGEVTEETPMYAHIWVNDGEEYSAWQTKAERMKYVENRTFCFELVRTPLAEGSPYWNMVIFSMYGGQQTYDLTVSQWISGATAYVTGETIENPVDSNRISRIARWKQSGMGGPHLVITSTGNIVGDTLLPGETTDDVLNAWTKNYPVLATDEKVAELKTALEELEINRPALPEYSYIANEDDRTATLVTYNGKETDVTLPSYMDGYKVTSIADTLFKRAAAEIKRVNIPATIQKVAPRTFLPCGSLTEITVAENSGYLSCVDGILFDKAQQTLICYPAAKGIGAYPAPYIYYNVPESVTKIYDGAFYRASHDNMVVDCGENVMEFGDLFSDDYAYPERPDYEYCRKEIDGQILIGSNSAADQAAASYKMTYARRTGDYAITKDGTLLRYYGSDADVTLPAEVKAIFGTAFIGGSQIKSIELGPYLTAVNADAFSNCPELSDFHLSMFNQAFTVTDGILYNIDQDILVACPRTTDVTLDLSLMNIRRISDYAFQNSKIQGFIGGSIQSIGVSAFSGCKSLKNVNLRYLYSLIEPYAFADCSALTQVTLPQTCLIKSHAFYGCGSLSGLDLRGANLQPNALDGCQNLKKVWILKEHVTAQDVSNLPALEAIVFKTGTKVIEDYAFSGFSSLKSVAIPPTVTSMGFSTFSGSTGLTIFGAEGSYAQAYANELKLPFTAVDASYFDAISFIKLGDIDGDGEIKTNDAIILQKYLSKIVTLTQDQMDAADTDKNGRLELNDVLKIQKYLAKIIDEI